MTTAENVFESASVFENISSIGRKQERSVSLGKFLGVPWTLNVWRRADHLGLYLYCDQEQEKEWSIDVWVRMRIRSLDRNSSWFSGHYTFEKDKDTNCGWEDFIPWKKLMKNYVIDDTLKVEMDLKIKKMSGIETTDLIIFDASRKQYSDVVLIVENQKFYVSKLYLASQSSYFEAMFLHNFRESKESEITLHDIKSDDFQHFLELLYLESPINDSTIDGIIKLADMYHAKRAFRKCEEFLIEKSRKTYKEKLQLAHRYSLGSLKYSSLAKITTLKDIGAALADNLNEMDPSVLGALLQKSLSARGN